MEKSHLDYVLRLCKQEAGQEGAQGQGQTSQLSDLAGSEYHKQGQCGEYLLVLQPGNEVVNRSQQHPSAADNAYPGITYFI